LYNNIRTSMSQQ